MKTLDLIGTAVSNTFRSKTRTSLTVLAIFVGAFTLTLTNGLGTGINRYIDDTVASFGASDVLTITKQAEESSGDGPAEYDPDAVTTAPGPESGGPGGTVAVITADDLDELAQIEGIEKVEPVRALSVDFIQHDDGTRYVIGAGSIVPGQSLTLAEGAAPGEDSDAFELALPESYVDPLGFSDDADAVGAAVTIAVTDATGGQHLIDATITGVAEETFNITGGAGSLIPNAALTQEIYDTQQEGVQEDQRDRYLSAWGWFDETLDEEGIEALQDELTDAGFSSTTVTQQLGAFKAVIDGIVLVLNAFAIIALLAAAFGIVNTLLMSVQERTREIGLMKAMGMGSGRVFSLFSLEAAFIGFLGSALGAAVAVLAGTALSSSLSAGFLADLPGLQLLAFDPVSISVTVLVVMGVAFLAGTLPALRAARQDPVSSLRYE